MAGPTDWPDDIFDRLMRARVRQVGYVPDAGHARLIQRCQDEPTIRDVVLTSEQEGVALSAGAWLGGERSAVLMQSSGVGNCINMLTLTTVCRFPLVLLVTMRGEWGEFNPWQVPMGSTTESVLRLCDVHVFRADEPGAVAETVEAALDHAFNSQAAVAVLLSQRLVGRKQW